MTPTTVYGFDLGHGETAVSISTPGTRVEARNLQLTRGGAKVVPTAVATDTNGETLIGFDAMLSHTATGLRAAFKHYDVTDPDVSQPIRLFVKEILNQLAESGSPVNGQLVFGHPSGWTQEQSTGYQRLLADIVGQTPAMVPEARAAFLPLRSTGEISANELESGRIVIIDMGSSTTDFALVRGVEDPADLGNPDGVQLGASLIDLALMQRCLDTLDRDDRTRIEAFLDANQSERTHAVLEFRRAKERFFESEANYRTSGRGPRPDLEILEDQIGVAWSPRLTPAIVDDCLNTPLPDLGIRADLFGRPTNIRRSWKSEFVAHVAYATQQLDPTTIILTGGAAKMGWVLDELKALYLDATIVRPAQPEHTIANGLALHGTAYQRTEEIRADIDAMVDSDAVENAVEDSWEQGVSQIIEPIVDGFVERFVIPSVQAWRRSELTTLNDIGTRSGVLAKKWTESDAGAQAIAAATIDWFASSIAPSVNDHIRTIADRYPDIPASSIELPADGLTVALGGATPDNALAKNNLTSELDNVLNTVIVIVSGVVSMAMFGAGTAAIATTGPGVVVAAAVAGALALAIGKDEALRRLNDADIAPLVRKSIPEGFLLKRIRKQASGMETQIRSELASQLVNDDTVRAQIVDEISALIDQSLKQRVRDASAHLI